MNIPRLNIHRFLLPRRYRNTVHFYNELKRYGHTLGLAVKQTDGLNNTISSEGSLVETSISLLSDLLDEYISLTNHKGKMLQVAEILRHEKTLQTISKQVQDSLGQLDFMTALYNWFRKLRLNNFIKHGAEQNGIYLYTVVTSFIDVDAKIRHAFYIIFNRNFIAISNRGAIAKDDKLDFPNLGVQIFKLKQGAFDKLRAMKPSLCAALSQSEVEAMLDQLKEGNSTLKFRFKTQKVGNCSLANIKSLIKPMLFMLGEADVEQIVQEYKAFTNWLREHEIKHLIKKYLHAKAKEDHLFMVLYADLLLEYIKNSQLHSSSITYCSEYAIDYAFSKDNWLTPCLRLSREDVKDHFFETESPGRRTKNLLIIYASLADDPRFADAFKSKSLYFQFELSAHVWPSALFPNGYQQEVVVLHPDEADPDHIPFAARTFFACKLITSYMLLWASLVAMILYAPIVSTIAILTGAAYALYKRSQVDANVVVEAVPAIQINTNYEQSRFLEQNNTLIYSNTLSNKTRYVQIAPTTSNCSLQRQQAFVRHKL